MGARRQVEGQLAQLRFGGRDYTQPGWVVYMEVVKAFKKNCLVYCQFFIGQTGRGKCMRIHKSTDTMTQHWTPCILPIYAVRGSDVDTLSQIDSASYANRKTPPPSQISPLGYWNCAHLAFLSL